MKYIDYYLLIEILEAKREELLEGKPSKTREAALDTIEEIINSIDRITEQF